MPKLDDLARRAGFNSHYFHRQFKAITGLTPRQWAAAHRAHKVRAELQDMENTVTEAIYDAGFNAGSRFYETSNKVLGMTPTALRQGGKDTDIRFAVGETTLGPILVAESNKGTSDTAMAPGHLAHTVTCIRVRPCPPCADFGQID